jgi:hypothetical protein
MMTHEQIQEIGKVAGREAAKEMLTMLGMDVSTPLEVQKDFAFLRMMRMGSHWGARAALTGFVTAIATAIGAWLWVAFTKH